MPHIPGRKEYRGFISPAPPKGAPNEVKEFMARTYGGLRETKYPGENKENKMRAARITWYRTKQEFSKKYPDLFRKSKPEKDAIPKDLTRKEKQIERGTKIEYKEHPELGKETARQIAIDHIRTNPGEYPKTGSKPAKGNPASVSKPKDRKIPAQNELQAARIAAIEKR